MDNVLISFTPQDIITIVAVIGAIAVIVKYITGVHDKMKQYDGYDKQIKEVKDSIAEVKDEQLIITSTLLAVLSGLKQLGANGKVTEAEQSLTEYMNKKAHGEQKNENT